ncbi:hypothetical protein ABIE64_002656 [Thalassospira sp. MBR-102]|uniref:phage nozzle protein n=1 Tax=Thalassospira sp. MBR-102 TaxID=3156466 RepID=UPI0033944F79
MALVSDSIPNLVNGVSQQPPALRMASQAEYQKNSMSSLVDGMGKRPPLKHVSKVHDGSLGAAYTHTINRDVAERYKVIIQNESLKVFTLGGEERTVAFPEGKAYLASSNPQADFRTVTVADYTFIVNRSKITGMDSTSIPEKPVEAIIFVKQANYSTDYKIKVNGTEQASFTTGSSGDLKTTTIAEDLKSDLTTNLGEGWSIVREGAVLHIKKNDGSDFEIKAEDSRSGTQLVATKDVAQKFSDLPTVAPRGFTVEIAGDESSKFDNYYVEFKPNNDTADFDSGVWKECVGPGIQTKIDPANMPHALVRLADGTFEFKPLDWAERKTGDEDSNPDPSFINRKINDIFFYKNRLGLLADENVIFSEASEFFNFFRTTVTTIVDSDVVDVAASHVKVSILQHAVPFNERLLLFSDQTQFTLPEGPILASEPPDIEVLTEFESSLLAKPVGSGKTVFFATSRGEYAGLREYYVMPETEISDAADITAHVPAYIKGRITKLAVSSNEDILFCLTDTEPNKVFVYKFFWQGNEKVQSSWSFFEFEPEATVLNVDFIDSEAFFVTQYADGVYLDKMPVQPSPVDPNAPFMYLLDRKVSNLECPSVTYDPITNSTSYELPYAVLGDIQVVSRHYDPLTESSPIASGVVLTKEEQSGNIVRVRGNHATTPVYIGLRYEQRYRFSTIYVKADASGGGKAVIGTGRLQIQTFTVVFSKSGFFWAEVTAQGRDMKTYKFTGKVIGSNSAEIGKVSLSEGSHTFPVLSKNDRVTIELVNDTYLPSNFLSAEWEGTFSMRSYRLGSRR